MRQMWHPEELQDVPCDSCGSKDCRKVFERPDGMQVVECSRCQLTFLNPRPKPEFIARFYDRAYYDKGADDSKIGYREYATRRSRRRMMATVRSRLDLFRPTWEPNGKRCLEIGCATGEFCQVLKENGSEVTGVDLSEFAILEARNWYSGIQFICGNLDVVSKDMRFDAAFGFELIEHLPSPRAFLRSLGPLIKTGGILVLSTPNLACGQAVGCDRWLGFHASFEHLYFFTPNSLLKIADNEGFQLVKWLTGGGMATSQGEEAMTLKHAVAAMLQRLGLLKAVQRIRVRLGGGDNDLGYTEKGIQHNLLMILQKSS